MVFVAFEERENLGVRYMSAVLSEAGYEVKIIDFRKDKTEILGEIITYNPLLVGFSIIFENYLYDFKDLIEYLRDNSIECHFTAGGHFASLHPVQLFEIIPSLDSIVRFEGEHILLDLVDHLHSGADWEEVTGLSYLKNGSLVNNQLRSLEPDLDNFPFPTRSEIKKYALDTKYFTLLAGRGCIYDCIFCDAREFYRQPPGLIKRIRNPAKVVEEMENLYKEKDCSVFLFQDDDFPVVTSKKSDWIHKFCKALRDKDLFGLIMWKINCRSDEISPDPFEMMREHGLFRVYLGIEDGTDSGLRQMNKRLKASDNLRGVNILKKLGISIDFGFMLFQPTTTYNSIRENLKFLELICSDGYMPVTFLKMMPYLETKIKKELMKEGRLKGKPGFLDYDFYDKSMNDFYDFVSDIFNTWLYAPNGFSNISKWASNYLSVFSSYNSTIVRIKQISKELKTQVSDANRIMLETLNELSKKFESGNYNLDNDKELNHYRSHIEETHKNALESITAIIEKIELLHLTREFFNN